MVQAGSAGRKTARHLQRFEDCHVHCGTTMCPDPVQGHSAAVFGRNRKTTEAVYPYESGQHFRQSKRP